MTPTRLRQIQVSALANGHQAVAATAETLLSCMSDLDKQINLVGAMQEAGYLKNSLVPLWRAFREDEARWINRCLTRLQAADHDFWAVSALLGCNGPSTLQAALRSDYKLVARRLYSRFDKPDVSLHTLYLHSTGCVLHPILEIGWDEQDLIAVDVARSRALLLKEEGWEPSQAVTGGYLSLYMRAKLPHGAWRIVDQHVDMDPAWHVTAAA